MSWFSELHVPHAPINGLPLDGGGGGGGGEGGQPTGNLTFSGFQMSIFLPMDLHYKSDSHPWGPQTLHSNFKELIGTHNTSFQHSASPQCNYLGTWQIVPTNFVHLPKWRKNLVTSFTKKRTRATHLNEFWVFSKIADCSSLIPRSYPLSKMAIESNFPPWLGFTWVARPPILGQTIDRLVLKNQNLIWFVLSQVELIWISLIYKGDTLDRDNLWYLLFMALNE